MDVGSDGSEGSDRAFVVYGCVLELRDLTVTGAHAEQYTDCADGGGACTGHVGGAFWLVDSRVTLERVRVTGNYADIAGAGDVYGSELVLIDSEIRDNTNGGFAVRLGGTLESVGTEWSGNDDRDVVLSGKDFRAGGATDFRCDEEECD